MLPSVTKIDFRVIAGILCLWAMGWLYPIPAGAGQPSAMTDARTRELFKQLRIIPMPGIAPPADIALKDVSGRMVRVSDFRGKIVFLNFWTTWCGDCKVEMPEMEKLHRALKDKDFVMLAVDLQESAATVKAFFNSYRLTFTALLDSEGRFGRRFGVRSIPTTFILNKAGGMIGKAIGSRPWGDEPARDLFESLSNTPDNK